MGIRIVVDEGETVSDALVRFERLRNFVYRRSWTKRRYGYHEKPSVVRRREDRLRQMRSLGFGWYHRFPIGIEVQLKRTGPANTIGQ